MPRRLPKAARVLAQIALVICASIVGLISNALITGSDHDVTSARAQARAVNPAALTASAQHLARQHVTGPRQTLIATARETSVEVYARPGEIGTTRRLRELPDSYGTKLVFLVESRDGDWLHVQLPVRPNLSSGWIRASAVDITSTDWRVVVSLRHHQLTVLSGSQPLLRAPVGVGRSVSPTPSGRYFITDLIKPPTSDSVFGPYAFGLSAYSDVYTTFAGGDGQIGLHGTDDPRAIGTDISHGCIRTPNQVITQLAGLLPLGTPVTITRN